MNRRTEEYWQLVGELSQPPRALEGSVERARKRARRSRLTRRLAAPAASLAAIAATFVLLVNVSVPFAMACSGVPIIRELTAAVAFSPSLSAAVAHDYVQYIGQSQTVDGVTVELGYAIVDPVQAVFFYSVDGNARFHTSPRITAADGSHVGSYATSSSRSDTRDGLDAMTLSFTAGSGGLPERFTLEMYMQPLPDRDQASEPAAPADVHTGAEEPEVRDPREDPGVLRFVFDVTLDSSRIAESKTVEVGRWVELDSQRILVDRLELFPTRTILYLGEDPDNTAWLRSLKFWFEDSGGNRYTNKDGSLSASGEENSQSFLTYYFQSFYYELPQGLTLRADRAEWLDKDAARVVLDLTTGQCPGLPDGVRVDEITRTGTNVSVKLYGPLERNDFGQTFGGYYWDPEGGEHTFNHWSGGSVYDDTGEETGTYEVLYLNGYPWDTVELELSYTEMSRFDSPISVPLTD